MFRTIIVYSMIVTLGLTTACSLPYDSSPIAESPYPEAPQAQPSNPTPAQSANLPNGQYPVQQASYDDSTGEYTLFLLNTPAGQSSTFRTANLPLARLTDEQIANGQSSYLGVENNQPSLYLDEDFRIEYVHNVTETTTNPQTGEPEVVVIDRQTSFWTPFAGALAGQALGSLLFTPHYYIPPVYRPGGILVGYGGYGRTYNQAVNRYQTRYSAPPAEVRNRQLRTAGRLRSPTVAQPNRRTQGDRATGSGYGSDTLRRRTNQNRPTVRRNPSGFGSRRIGGRRGGFRRR
ncbi:hypothetical protein H6G89_12600 [Oscillatoria sp. FACHB-1407]|uniref:hypothetical protein n=1 Tax=Oscillatoria sp. FACHB-1407 TaxID=2692847 RepID=UPI0016883C2F|nr:hypothetical protein [Oscillatoria sp. FACHB-1407]MBD2461889.1 hypothetical protein [Oscillatoria sp. FACHB-1407]